VFMCNVAVIMGLNFTSYSLLHGWCDFCVYWFSITFFVECKS
jgi:hypothetical protein